MYLLEFNCLGIWRKTLNYPEPYFGTKEEAKMAARELYQRSANLNFHLVYRVVNTKTGMVVYRISRAEKAE